MVSFCAVKFCDSNDVRSHFEGAFNSNLSTRDLYGDMGSHKCDRDRAIDEDNTRDQLNRLINKLINIRSTLKYLVTKL